MTNRPGFLRDDGQFAATSIAAWAPATGYTAGVEISNDTPVHIYRCTQTGTSAGSGGPTGTDRVTELTDNTCKWLYIGDTASTTTAPPDGIRQSGYPVNAFVPSAWFNWLHQKVDDFLKYLEESRPPGGGRRPNTATAPSLSVVAGRVFTWNEFYSDLDYTVGGVTAARRIKVAVSTLDLATDNTHYVYVSNSTGLVTSDTIATTAMTGGAPLARIVTAGGNITSILPINLLPVAVDESGPSGPILVGASVTNNRAHTTNLLGAMLHDKIRVDAGLPRRGIKLVGNVSVSATIDFAEYVGPTTKIDLNGYSLNSTHAGALFALSGTISGVEIFGGGLGATNAGATHIFSISAAAAEITRLHIHDTHTPSAQDEANVFFGAVDHSLNGVIIERCIATTQEQFIDIKTSAVNNSDIRNITVRDCRWEADGAGSSYGIGIYSAGGTGIIADIKVDKCRVEGAAVSAIYIDDAENGAVTNCHVKSWGDSQTGIYLSDGSSCLVQGNYLDGAGITTPNGITSDSLGGAIIGNVIKGIATGANWGIKTTYDTRPKTVTGNSLGGSDNDTDTGGGDISTGNG